MKIKFELEEKMPYIKGLSEGSQKISWCSCFFCRLSSRIVTILKLNPFFYFLLLQDAIK